MSSTTVDDKYRIVIEKKLRKKVKIKPGDKVIVEPMDDTRVIFFYDDSKIVAPEILHLKYFI